MVFLLPCLPRTAASSNKGPEDPELSEEALVLPGKRILDFFFIGLVLMSTVGAVLIISGGFGSGGVGSESTMFDLADSCGSDAFLDRITENLLCLEFSVWIGGEIGRRPTSGAWEVSFSLLRVVMWRLEGVGAVDIEPRRLAEDTFLGICSLALPSGISF